MTGLEVLGLSKRFGDVQAVADVSLRVRPGEMIGFLGPNGAGKTTTMRSIVNMVRPDAGEIRWNGRPIGHSALHDIGYMPQERGLYARMRAHEQVAYFGRLAGLSRTESTDRATYWLDRVGLSERSDALVQELSGGNQQRVQLAVSLVHDPELLVLDEPFSGLDPVATDTMQSIIAEHAAAGSSVLFSSHQLDLVEELCKEVVIISAGRIVAAGAIVDLRSASPRRRLRVRWADAVDDWRPLDGHVLEFDGVSAIADVSTDGAIAAHLANVNEVGAVVQFAIDPPSLDEMFSDLVGSGDPS